MHELFLFVLTGNNSEIITQSTKREPEEGKLELGASNRKNQKFVGEYFNFQLTVIHGTGYLC